MNDTPRPSLPLSTAGVAATPELTACLLSVFSALERPFVHPMEVAAELQRLLTYLESEAGYTPANCEVAGRFFAEREGWGEIDWDHLPAELGDVLALVAEGLHLTFADPVVAENLGATPAQILRTLEWTGYVRAAR